jgi:hypothetical protein
MDEMAFASGMETTALMNDSHPKGTAQKPFTRMNQ